MKVRYKINTKLEDKIIGSEMKVQDGSTTYVLRDYDSIGKEDSDFSKFALDQMLIQTYGKTMESYKASNLKSDNCKDREILEKFDVFNGMYRNTLQNRLPSTS